MLAYRQVAKIPEIPKPVLGVGDAEIMNPVIYPVKLSKAASRMKVAARIGEIEEKQTEAKLRGKIEKESFPKTYYLGEPL